MAANFSYPVLTGAGGTIENFPDHIKANINQVAAMFEDGTGDNIPTGSVRLNKTTFKFEQWTGAAWAEMSIVISGSAASLKDNTTTGVMTITGLTAGTTSVKTLRDADDTILEAGGQYTISGASWTFNNTITGSINGNAATATILATARKIYGNNFNGSAALTQVIASTYGGTGNGFTKFTGPATSEKTFTLPNVSATLLYSGGALGTPSSGTLTNCTFPTLNQDTTGNAATATLASNLANGGGVTSASGASYISVNSTDSWAYISLKKSGVTIWDIAQNNGGNLEFRSAGSTARATLTSAGVLTAATFSGSLSGNATTATKVNNALTAGTGLTSTGAFDGSAARTFSVNFGVTGTTVCVGNDSRLLDSRKCNNTFDNAATSRTNLGASTVGGNLFTLTNNSSTDKYISISPTNVPLYKTYAQVLSDIGAAGANHTHGNITNDGKISGGVAWAPLQLDLNGNISSGAWSTATPQMNGIGNAGAATTFSRSDHVHPTDTSRAASSHTHGSITTDGKIGSTAGLVIVTGASGVLTAKAAGSVGQFLAYNGAWATPPNTTYTGATGIVLTGTEFTHSSANGYKHIPADGAAGKILGYASAGTAQWVDATSPAGNNGNIQFNNAGAFGGSDSLNCSAICSLVGSVNDTTYIQNGVSVQVRDKYAYVITYNKYLSIYDVSVANPVRIASVATPDGPTFADIQGNYAYVCAYAYGTQAGIQVFDISNPTAPVFVARAARVNNLFRCIARGGAVYAVRCGGTGASGLYVYDVTNPSVPVLSGSVLNDTHFDAVVGLDYQNKYIFSVGENGRITATDVSNPASPTVVSSLSDATNLGGAKSIKVRGNYAYVAASTVNRITVINIKDPANMVLAGTLQLNTNLAGCREIELIGDYAILPSMTNSRLTIINISNPASPSEFYSLADATNLNGVVALTVNGSKVYAIASTGKRLSVFNIPGINIPSLNAGAILADNVSVNNSFIGRYGTFHNFSAGALSSENLTVKNFNVRQPLAASAGAATSTYLTLTINGTIYKIALLANS